MAEIPIAFPNDETTAEVIAARLRAAGITARVDRGLFGSRQVSARGQMTVFVDEGDADRARNLVGKVRTRALTLSRSFGLGLRSRSVRSPWVLSRSQRRLPLVRPASLLRPDRDARSRRGSQPS